MACKFTDLPASSVDSKGRVTYYSYYIEEITPDGYDLQVTYGDPRTSGLEYYTATMTNKEQPSAKVNWTSLPEYTKDGKAITYSIEEAAVEDYTMLTPTYDEATKTWTVTNKLGKASTPLSATKTMKGGATPADGYSFKLEAIDGAPMPDGESGRAVSPLTVTNVAGTINFGTINFKRTDLGSDASRTFQYTITEVAGSDANMIYDPAIYTVSVVVSYNSTTGELTAAEPTYTKKANATAADENVSSVTFQNEETTEIFVHKAWPGDVPMADEVEFWVYTKNAQGGFVEVRQKADGTDYDLGGDARYTANIKLNSANSWSGSLTGLPKYDNSGNQIQYYVVERGVTFNGEQTVYKWEVTDYFTVSPADAAYNGDNTVGIEVASDNSESKPLTITNTPLTTSITVTKKWEDSGMQDRVPEGATAKFKLVKVVRNSDNQITGLEEVKVDNAIVTVTLNGTVDATPTGTGIAGYESGAWKATFLNMPKFDANGKKITYAVVEVEQDDVYTVSYSTTEGSYQYAANDGWVNNQYTSFIVEKRWMTGGFANWDKDYGEENDQVKTIYFRLYRQVDGGTPVMVDEHGDPVTSGNGVMELKYSDVVKAPLTQYNTGGVDVAQGTDVHWMRKFPLLPGTNGEYFAVECSKPNGTAEIVEYGDKNNKGAALDAYKDIYMICPEFGGKDVETEEPTDHGTFCLKNKLIKVNVDKTWLATDYDDYVLKLQLLRNGEVYRTVNVEKGSNNWHYEMDDLPMANVEDGTTYSYGWNEIGVYASLAEAEADADGTSDKNLISNFTVTDPDVNTNSAHAFELSFTIINKELTYLDVVKKWSLNGGDPTDDTTDLTEISFYLYRKDGSGNSEIVDSATKIGKNAKKDVEHPEGAEAFTITRALKSGSTTDYEWKLHIDGLEKTDASGNAYTYWIQEVTVPGYSTTPTIKLANGTDVNATSNAPAESTIVITNSKFTVSLPSTGGTGTTIFYGAGLSLMLFAFLGFILNARKRSRGEGI